MKIKYLILLTVLLIFSAVVLSCKKGQTTSTPQSGGAVTSITESNPLEEEIEKIPEIEVNQSHVTIGVGDKFTLTARADNVENASFLWNFDGDADTEVISFVQNGNDVVITALKVGATKLIASIEVDGTTYYKSVEITTLQTNGVSVILDSNNLSFNTEGYYLKLSIMQTSELVTYDAYQGTTRIDGITISWQSEDTNVVDTNGNYFIPKSVGVTTVIGYYNFDGEVYTVDVEVEIYKPVEQIDEEFTIEIENLKDLEITSTILGIPQGVVYNGEVVGLYNADKKIITLDKSALPKSARYLGENLVMSIQTSLATYEFSVNMYTKILDSEEDLDGLESLSKSCSSDSALWDGYFILGADIDYDGLFKNRIADYAYLESVSGGNWHNGVQNGFKGVFDGKGHVIDGMEIENGQCMGAMFGVLHVDGVIKNVTFTNASVSANSSLVCGAGGGSVENIYVQYSSLGRGVQRYEGDGSINSHTATFFGFKEPTPTANVTNCIIDVTKAKFDTKSSIKIVGIEHAVIKNVFVIGGTVELRDKSNATATFENVIEFIEDDNVQTRYSRFDSSFWSLEFGAPVSNAVYESICDREVGFIKEDLVEYLVVGTQYKFPISNDFAYVTVDYDGVEVKGGVATVLDSAVVGQMVNVTVTSVFDDTKKVECKVTIIDFGAEFVDLASKGNAFYDLTEGKVYLATLSEMVESEILYYVSEDLKKPLFAMADEGLTTVLGVSHGKTYRIVCESVTKVIDSADDLHYVRRNYTVSYEEPGISIPGLYDGVITGKFVLVNDVDCTGLVLENSGTFWENSRGFGGIFDGGNYTIKNLSVSKNGLFGTLSFATIQNVKFEGVRLKESNGTGEGVALFANSVYNTTVNNVYIEFVEYVTNKTVAGNSGLMFHEKSFDSTFTDITLDVSKIPPVAFLTEYNYGDKAPLGSKEKSTYYNVTVIIPSDAEDPVFAYKLVNLVDVEEIAYPKGIIIEVAE